MTDTFDSAAPPSYTDRSGGLRVFGGLTILMGCFSGLLVLLLFWASSIEPQLADASASNASILPGVLVYGTISVILIWLGVGSIQARRWARAILLVVAWSALFIGVVSLPFVGIASFQAMKSAQASLPAGQPPMPSSAMLAVVCATVLIFGTIMVALPAIWVFFYSKSDVKATCESRDPVTRWTDRCPLPVLAVSLWLAVGAVSMLLMPLAANGVFPLFGTLVSGTAGTAVFLVLTVVWIWAARGFYRRDIKAWWTIVIWTVLFAISHVVTYSQIEIDELYRVMGYSVEKIDQMKKYDLFTTKMMVWPMLIILVPSLGYLVWIKRLFAQGTVANGASSAS